jgi:sugar transferase EpsL
MPAAPRPSAPPAAAPAPVLFPPGVPVSKRLFDLLLSVPGFLLAAPVLGALALIVLLTQGRPVLFRQARGGYRGRVFYIYKFRTMREAFDAQGNPLPDAARLSTVGRFMRATSLDELPELVNVLRGEMSLVGPRPLMARYLERYSPEQMRRHEALPGITGWAQVNGRNALSWEERFRLDVWYVDQRSLALDVRIIALTLLKVVRREGISQPGHATMSEFMGTSTPAQPPNDTPPPTTGAV